ncbi:proline iminopeptidase [Flavobacterium resistens]|uniref:Alpha/beta fold hydrolase n=1 Tax=Flavobacterium resistens TaxID=443612 RepID=A0A521E6Y9_9FLAO|nr:alpha/beta hydrolase [Flavobacterium resistens]MRX69125.1 alpha/beta fold hydrolase [Flavobacterium resistens]SMO79704.1 proline iminopeptidase [Flavobacterium resistens]
MKNKMLYSAVIAISIFFFLGCENENEIDGVGNLVPKTVDQDSSLPSIFINGTQLHAETFGNPNNPMLVFLHGGPGSDYRNGLNVQQLANEGYYVIFYDQRGSGLSKRHDKNSYSIQLVLDDLTEVIQYYRTFPNQKIFLFGHSWGAMLGAAYVNSYPDKIDGLILAEPGGLNKQLLDDYGEMSRKINIFSEVTSNLLYADQFLTGKENQHEILDYKYGISSSFSYAKGNKEGIPGPSPFWRIGTTVLESFTDIAENDGFDFTTNLNQYTTKVLFLYGELNQSYGLRFAQKEAAYFPNSEISEVKGTGHEMIYFKWENVHPIVLKYLNELK